MSTVVFPLPTLAFTTQAGLSSSTAIFWYSLSFSQSLFSLVSIFSAQPSFYLFCIFPVFLCPDFYFHIRGAHRMPSQGVLQFPEILSFQKPVPVKSIFHRKYQSMVLHSYLLDGF